MFSRKTHDRQEARATHFVVLQLCCSDFSSGFVTMVAVLYGRGDYSNLGEVCDTRNVITSHPAFARQLTARRMF